MKGSRLPPAYIYQLEAGQYGLTEQQCRTDYANPVSIRFPSRQKLAENMPEHLFPAIRPELRHPLGYDLAYRSRHIS
jgi:hypothetical protein